MKLNQLFAALVTLMFLGAAQATSSNGGLQLQTRDLYPPCNSGVHSEVQKLAFEADFELRKSLRTDNSYPYGEHVTIEVYFNVIYAAENEAGGYVPEQQIKDQISILNKAFHFSGIKFTLVKTTYVENKDWFLNVRLLENNPEHLEMKRQLRQGDALALNIYTVGIDIQKSKLLGYATFPVRYADNPLYDGVTVYYATLPGGKSLVTKNNEGYIAAHQVGHWAGLYHTFQDGCSVTNDMVNDTAAQYAATYGCPFRNLATCRSSGGIPPIHNIMDFTDDDCKYDPFSAGQMKRAQDQLHIYRGLGI